MANPPPQYSPLHKDNNGSLERLLDEYGKDESQSPASELVRRWSLRRLLPWLVQACLLFFNILFFLVQLVGKPSGPPTVAACLELTEVYSPVFEAVEYEMVKVEAVFDTVSPYMGSGPEVDAAWDRLTWNSSLELIRLSDEDLKKLHKDGRPSNARLSEDYGGGNVGTLNIIHLLHCVDFIRKYVYSEDYPSVQELLKTRPIFMKYHIDHCIDMVRQSIMCNADVGVATYDWVDDFAEPSPDFNVYKKCRRVDKIMDWVDGNRLGIHAKHLKLLGNEIPLAALPGATQTPSWEITRHQMHQIQ